MLAVCMGPLEKHCSKLRAISPQIHDIKNAANSHCVCHELKTCVYIQVCTISKFIGINEKKKSNKIYLPNKEYVNDHRHERKNMAGKCEVFVTVT